MASPDEFYITLPSTASMTVFPKNSQSNWSTVLNPPIELDNAWEVGLSEMHIPKMWKNISNDNCSFFCDYQSTDKDTVDFLEPFTDIPGKTHLADFSYTIDISGTQNYTRKSLFNALFISLSNLRYTNMLVHDHPLFEGVSIKYKQFDFGIKGLYERTGVTLFIKDQWSIVFELTHDNDNWKTLCRLLSIGPETLYKPITKSLTMNINDNMEGEQDEFIGKIKNGITMRICCPHFEVSKGYNVTPRQLMTYKASTMVCRVPTGYYATIGQLIEALNKALPPDCSSFLMFRQEGPKLKIISFNCKLYSVTFHTGMVGEKLLLMLGLQKSMLDKGLPHMSSGINESIFSFVNGQYPIDLNRGCHGFYVYCDLIVPEHVGDTSAHLLRVLPVDNAREELAVYNYSSSPHYKRLAVNYITKIHMLIKTDSDEIVKFLAGKSLCELHFRRMKPRK
jgi:hypothetical protein